MLLLAYNHASLTRTSSDAYFATRCIESKCDYKTVSVILGHSSLATTMDLYVHPGHQEKKQAIEKMARALG